MERKTDRERITGALERYSSKKQEINTVTQRYIYELAELVCDRISSKHDIAEELRGAYKEILGGGLASCMDKARLALYITSILSQKLGGLELSDLGIPCCEKPTVISYVKNAYSDMAYRSFDTGIGQLLCEYSDGFASAAQSVYYENVTGCILPIVADDGTVMTGIAKLAEKYELKKTALAGVSTGGVQSTKFALFTHGIWSGMKTAEALEFTVKAQNGLEIGDILFAARLFGYKDASHSSRISTENGEGYESFVLKGGSNKANMALVIYLTVEFERYDLTGLYNEFEEV